ncbi:MAG: thiamine phosphate synthase [Gammaproteobacteria bacterium]
MKKAERLSGLYVITDGSTGRELLHKVELTLRGGARLVQYRDKAPDAERKRKDGLDLRKLCATYDALLIVNDDISLAADIGADGVHLGRHDADIIEGRTTLGAGAIVGVSCYNQLALAHTAENGSADYIAFGSVFPSPTKPDAVRADLALLRQSRRELSIPVCAIGGITLDNAPSLLAAGADMLAVISAVFAQADPQAAASGFSKLYTADANVIREEVT